MGRYENSSHFTAALCLIAHAKSKRFKFPSFLYKEDDEDILFDFINLNTFSNTEVFISISDSNCATLVHIDGFEACIVSWGVEHVPYAANPFGERDFYNDKTRDGSVTIPDKGELTFRYRVLIHQGDLDSIKVEPLYAAFAKTRN